MLLNRQNKQSRQGFTLVEVMVVCGVLSLFLAGVFTLFSGGQNIAAKSSWLQYTIDRHRLTQQAIFKAVKTSSYPSTILPSKIYDAGGTEEDPGDNASSYFVHIVPGVGKIKSEDIIKSKGGVFLVTVRAEPEMAKFQDASVNKAGTICWNIFSLRPSPNGVDLGTIYMEERTDSYSTNSPSYAESLVLKYDSAKLQSSFKLAEDVEWIEFLAENPGYVPSELKITVSSRYFRDEKLTRQSVIKMIPNVGIKTS